MLKIKMSLLFCAYLLTSQVEANMGAGLVAPQISDETYVSNPHPGELIFNTTLNALKVYNGLSWDTLGTGTGGGIEEVDSMVLTSDYTDSSPVIGAWDVPNTSFKVTVPTAGDYRVNLKALIELIPSSAAIANQVLFEVGFFNSTTPGTGSIAQVIRIHKEFVRVNQNLYETINWTTNTFTAAANDDIYVHIRVGTFSGSPTLSSYKLRSESGAGAGIDPILTLTKVGN